LGFARALDDFGEVVGNALGRAVNAPTTRVGADRGFLAKSARWVGDMVMDRVAPRGASRQIGARCRRHDRHVARERRDDARRRFVVGMHLERPPLVRLPLVRQHLVQRRMGRPPLVRSAMVNQHLVRFHLGRSPLVRLHLVRQLMVRSPLVRTHLVRRQLDLTNRQRSRPCRHTTAGTHTTRHDTKHAPRDAPIRCRSSRRSGRRDVSAGSRLGRCP